MKLALRLARRELRGGVRGLRIVLACLALGVAVIATVGTLRVAIDLGLATDSRKLLGGDLEVEVGSQPIPDALRAWFVARGARLSEVVELRTLLVAPSGERTLVELKAVDPAWPLVGTAVTAPQTAPLVGTDGQPQLLTSQVVLDRLGLHPGNTARLGRAGFTVAGALVDEPDALATPALFGPHVLIPLSALPATGLVVPGSLVTYRLRVLLPPGTSTTSTLQALRAAFPNEGWRIRDPGTAAPQVQQVVNQASLFMALVGLTSLLVGGIGVANGVRAWLEARARTIATLRCLGASARLMFAVALIQVMALAIGGILVGLVVGTALPVVGARLLQGILPVPPVLGIYPQPLAIAAAYGMLTALGFALLPLGRAARIPGAALFRDALLPDRVRPPPLLLAGTIGLGAALIALTVVTAHDRGFALWFCAAALGTLALFRLGSWTVMRVARLAPRLRAPWARLGLANLHRPGAATPMLLVSVGLGLSTLAAVALIEGNIRHQIADQMPANAPSFYFIDIQPDQLARFEAIVHATPGATDLQEVPALRARLVSVGGVPVEHVHATPDTRWALRGDRGLTYAATPPPGTRIVAGQWWPPDYDGPPLVSFDAGLAKGWGVGLGDVIRVNVLGRDIDLRIASLRDIAWRSLSLNYAMIASPGLLSHAPHGNIATVRAPASSQGPLLRAVTDALPNVTGIRVADILASLADLLDRVAAALTATGSLTLLSGGLVLIGAVAAGQRRRTQEAVILKALGASRAQIRAAWLVEFGLLGLTAGLIAAVVGTAASWVVAHYVLQTAWAFLPGTLAGTVILCLATMLVFGYAGTAAALRAKAAPLLRNE
ncbi:MAG TPA: FtsX-like permease family protein [Acetobacteraceae bacterium]|nr:FtsX-like permease family protein [Acetobacteraceae bacterium]